MTTRTTFALALALVAVVSGCESEVNGGGGGAGGAGGGANVAQGTGGDPSTTSAVTATSGGPSTGSGGTGGSALGECTPGDATSGSSGSGISECLSGYSCDGGEVEVTCVDDGTTETCDCNLGGAFVGSCIDEDRSGCSFPQNCCFSLLGGQAEPNPGPYGACEWDGGTGSGASGGGTQECTSFLACDGGDARIDCSQSVDGGDATCACHDGQGFLLGTCSQPSLDCMYESSCCYDILN